MLIAIVVVLFGFSWRALRRRRTSRDAQRFVDALLETLDLVLATLRAGYSLPQSLSMLSDIGPDIVRPGFAAVRAEVEKGIPLTTALATVRENLGAPFGPLIGLWISALRLGIPLDSLMSQMHIEARLLNRQRGEMAARRLSVRLTLPLVLCTLPSFVVLIIVPIVAGTIQQLRLNGGSP